jgi:hypothetical protein
LIYIQQRTGGLELISGNHEFGQLQYDSMNI